MKSLKNIEGFDDVGLGVINCGKGNGEYILCRNLNESDLKGVQIYRYNNSLRIMRKADALEEDSIYYTYCVKREDLERLGE